MQKGGGSLNKNTNQIETEEIKNSLKHYSGLSAEIHRQIMQLKKDLDDVEIQALEMAAYPKTDLAEKGGSRGIHKDLTDVYLRYQSIVLGRQQDLLDEITYFTEKSENLHRLYLCSQAISGDGYEIISRLYFNNEKYKVVEMESGLSHRIFEQKRQQAIRDIQRLYESDLTNRQILEMQKIHMYDHKFQRRKKESNNNDAYQQMELDLK